MTVSDTLQFIGSEIPVTYYNGSDYVTTSALYDTSVTPNFTEYSENPVDFVTSGSWLVYTFTASSNTSPNFITVSLQPTYSLFDTTCVYTTFALSRPSNISAATYQSPQCNWYIGGSIHNFYNSAKTSSESGVYSYLHRDYYISGHRDFSYIPIAFSSQSTFSAYAVDCAFYGNSKGITDNSYVFLVQCPYVSSGASGASGTFTTVSSGSGGGTDINVNVDMSETNSLLENIFDGISGIGDVILHVFFPEEAELIDFASDLVDLIEDSFSGYEESQDILDDIKSCILDTSTTASLTFPAISIPHTSFQLPARTVNLSIDDGLLEWVRLAIDLVATCAFINLIRLKIDEVIHGKVVVESDEVDLC